MRRSIEQQVWEDAATYGFDTVGITSPDAIKTSAPRLSDFIAQGHHGEMAWMAETEHRRSNPHHLWPECRSVILLGISYAPAVDPLQRLEETQRGIVAAYAKGRDYHELIKGRLKQIAGRLATRAGADVKVFVDTAPLMEKPLAAAAGLGWQGKHTNLVSRDHGSWLLLGAILTTAELGQTQPEADHCGSCRQCLDICPTNAFPAPYQLDARRCIAYLTIEHPGDIPLEFRSAIGNRVFGCDDCLAICPWNKFAEVTRETKFHARVETDDPDLEDLAGLDDAMFRKRFAGTPVKRTGRDRFVRNVLIALGNTRDGRLAGSAIALLTDPSPLVRAMAVWAASQLLDKDSCQDLAARHLPFEKEQNVKREWDEALNKGTSV